MMSLKEKITQDIKTAFKGKDSEKTGILRLLANAINQKEIEKRGRNEELTEEDVLAVLKTEAKKRKEAARQFQEGGRPELAEKEEKELVLIKEYLPEEMSEEKVRELADEAIKETGALSAKETGKVMAALMPKLKGAADGALVGQIVREKLSGNNE